MQKRKLAWSVVLACAVAVFFIWQLLLAQSRGVLTVSFLDVGQGDAIFIESPTGQQVLIDGGRDRSVLRELGEVMSWGDRRIDLIVPTHPDADHIAGLIDVLNRYDVSTVLQTSVEGDTDLWRTFKTAVDGEGAEIVHVMRGQVIDLGGGARLQVLFPDRAVPHVETNTGSTVLRLVYGNASFLLTGDSPIAIEKYLMQLDGGSLQSTVLKAGHHGSRTSSSKEYIDTAHPGFAVFSRGCDNSYGHPHKEIVALFAAAAIPTFDTCIDGRISFVSDGEKLWFKK